MDTNINSFRKVSPGFFRWLFIFCFLPTTLILISCSFSQFNLQLLSNIIPSRTYYIDAVNGLDSNPGSSNQPFKTIQEAANIVSPGDVVTILPGTYAERVQVKRSGSPNKAILFQAQGDVVMQGFTVKADFISIKGFEITDTPDDDENGIGIYVTGSFCDIENNYIHYATRGGITLSANQGHDFGSRSCIVRNNRLYQNSQNGIQIFGRDHLIEGNEIWGSIQYHPKWANPPSKGLDADGIRFFGSGHIIRNNYIHDILYGIPENKDPHIDCFQTWGNEQYEAASNVLIERNRCDNAQAQSPVESGSGLMIQDSTGGLIIRNNLINAFVNVYLARDKDITIINNTFTSDTKLNKSFYPSGISVSKSTDIFVENNIFYNQPGEIIGVEKGGFFFSGKNIIFRADGEPLYHGNNYDHTNDLWNIDPLFIDPAGNNYHLKANSPAIEAGYALTNISDDYDGNPRPSGKPIDIGAFQYIENH